MNKAIPTARRAPTDRTSDGLNAVAADEELLDEEEFELEVPEEVPEEVPLLLVVPVLLDTAVPGRLTVCLAARAWKASSEREALAVVLASRLDLDVRLGGDELTSR